MFELRESGRQTIQITISTKTVMQKMARFSRGTEGGSDGVKGIGLSVLNGGWLSRREWLCQGAVSEALGDRSIRPVK
jgi:hypothetical protein